ncbi:PREDICTED: uncharacterized protein LOC107065806 [Polistes dominula]|uniref:Uncharacterized protein LOC107065806 n=1 Tax=Polistes dominula TaxID=743375 RepID=A0ABM1I4Z7_POLDO|nr:PREDICTED: uncharacterized protein LOC107065806 [Polistes dominula]
MFSINMRLFKTTIFLFLLFAFVGTHVKCLPLDESEITSPTKIPSSSSLSSSEDHYDQRQNGTENYRVHIDGVVIVVAPVEALLMANDLINTNQSGISTIPSTINYPKPDDNKPNIEHSEKPSNENLEKPSTEHLEEPNTEHQSLDKLNISSKSTKRYFIHIYIFCFVNSLHNVFVFSSFHFADLIYV